MPPRVRFAPSPTGHLHVGGARTALFNWLFARGSDGAFLLRIEDTDRERSSEAMTRSILDAMEWLGLDVDEPPLHQADGIERHRQAVERLLKAGKAYRCFADPEELKALRRRARDRGEPFRFPRDRWADRDEAARRTAEGESFAALLAVPDEPVSWEDAVHGETGVEGRHLDDFVIQRSDGTPVYNLAVVVDDLHMRITHVLRGDDHLSNTPKQILVYRGLGAEPPTFGHLPMILGPDGKRLSKRHGATSVEAYREKGILPEAMVNFLALLGWSPGDDREVMEPQELVEAFSLDRILKKSAVFDADKLEWLNGQHLSRAAPGALVPAVVAMAADAGLVDPERLEAEPERLRAVIELTRIRARTVEELARQVAPFFAVRVEYDPDAVAKVWKDAEGTRERLQAVRAVLESTRPFEEEPLEEALRERAAELEVGAGKLIHPLRVALMGVAVGPGIFETLTHMGRDRSLARIDAALAFLEPASA